jgi:hypothetical protein
MTRAEIEQAVKRAETQAEHDRKPGDIDLDVYDAFIDTLERSGITVGPRSEFSVNVYINP